MIDAAALHRAAAVIVIGAACLRPADLVATTPDPFAAELGDMSLEELMDIEVTLTARKAEPLFETAAAVAVLTADDLRRAGVTSIPEALRLIPGMVVGRADASKWAVSARGFNGVFANKLLVLIDGRSVYTPTFSGVYWESQDVLLADVERIEVVRGPGAALWGTNAVNGIVNVVTREARHTRGTYLRAGGGSEERGFVEGRRGGALGAGGTWRVWGRGFARDALVDSTGAAASDDWAMARGGFRLDGPRDARATWTVQGDLYRGRTGQTYRFVDLEPPYRRVFDDDTRLAGGNLLGRWEHGGEAGTLTLQAYYDRTERDDALLRETRDTGDLDLQQRLRWRVGQELLWGVSYRITSNDTRGSIAASLDPPGRTEDVISAFVQHETRLLDDRLRLTAGSKVEHNDHTAFEWQPSARLWWRAAERQALWASAARAVRVPSQADEDVRLNLLVSPPGAIYTDSPVTLGAVIGTRDLGAERLTAFEVGYRARPRADLSVDAAAFLNHYRDLRTGRVGLPYFEPEPTPTHLVAPFRTFNGLAGTTWGWEAAADWRALPGRWRLRGAWSYLRMDLEATGMSDPRAEGTSKESPEHQLYLWSSLDLSRRWQLDTILRYVSDLPFQDNPSYLVADLRLGWEPRPGLELELVGRNLLDRRHREFRAFFVDSLPTQTQSEIYASLRWRPAP